jgi:hypothetical protein
MQRTLEIGTTSKKENIAKEMATTRNGPYMLCKSHLGAAEQRGALDALEHLPKLGGRLCANGHAKQTERDKF